MTKSLEKQLLEKEIAYYNDNNLSVEEKHLQDMRNKLPASQYRSYLADSKKS